MKVVSKRPKRHSFLLFLILTLIISSLLYNSDQLLDPPKKVPFAEFRADLNEGLISDNAVSIKGDKLTFKSEESTNDFKYTRLCCHGCSILVVCVGILLINSASLEETGKREEY